MLEKERITSVSKARDVIKLYAKDAEFVLIGLENQMNIHYAMSVRSMLYDALRYTTQCKILEQKHRINKDLKGSDEFLSGTTKNDRLKPVITLVVYYGEKQWDDPKKLSDMLNISPLFQRFINEQSIHLLQVRDTRYGDLLGNTSRNWSCYKFYGTRGICVCFGKSKTEWNSRRNG